MKSTIANLLLVVLASIGVRPASAADLNSATGNISKVDVTNRCFELLTEIEYVPKSDLGQSRFTVPWTDKTVITKVEEVTSFAGIKGLVIAESQGIEAADDAMLTVPIRFHVSQGVTMTVKGQAMDVWVKPEDLTGPVIGEVNRIWKPANIQFEIERAQIEPLLKPADFAELLKSVENAKRGDEEERGSKRTDNIQKLLDPAQRHPSAHNIYLLPYIGGTYQGYAQLGGTQVVVGVWTDKFSRGEKPPVMTLLVEPEPMKVGSLARTIAHELGHNLGLTHPDKSIVSPVGRLMGGRTQGYGLTPEEIATARQTARRHLAAK